ncbi:MAG TPA: TonB-dependent receptor [Janthinobacterium sp.]|jgi:iron complex outermembrane receptor protein|nr:TonB-dependent receptor [Janthinobacterium sp.]
MRKSTKSFPFACLALLGSTAGQVYAAGQSLPPAVPDKPAAQETPAGGQAAPPAAPVTPAAPATAPSAGAPLRGGRAGRQAPAAADKALPQITVNGSRASDMDERRQSIAGKQVYGREELDRNGDTSLADVLKRLPGVTIGGRPGRGGEIRMRGLGNGYTQILVNGERPPPGFSLDQLSPDQVERVEVIRGAIAEYGTRAIAGTINIVLRDGYQQRDRQLKFTDSEEQGRHAPNLSLVIPGTIGKLTYLMSATVQENHQRDQVLTHNLDLEANGVVDKDQLVDDTTTRETRSLHLTPRISYKFDGGDTLNFQPFLMATRSDGNTNSLLDQSAGVLAPDYATAEANAHSSSTFLRGFGNWVHKMDGAAKLDVKFGAGTGHSSSDTLRDQYDAGGALLDHFVDDNSTRDRSVNGGVKFTKPLGQGHLLAAGLETEMNRRDQTQVSLDNGLPSFDDSGDNLTADTRRVAGWAQDEWEISPEWSTYLGLRWESIRTSSTLAGIDIVNESRVWSPLWHAVWHIPGHPKDQVRASLTRSYRSPSLTDLIALPALSHLNSATKPDRTGNPYLKPELATGLDMAYEHYLGRAGIVSIGGFVRDISDLMRRATTLQDTSTGPRWVSSPLNIGKARTSGIELEAKFQLVELMPDAPAIDFRSNYSRFWSSVASIPLPNARLDGQPTQTANVGADWHVKGLPLTLGASVNWTPATLVDTEINQVTTGGAKTIVDVYGLWKFTPGTQLRISGANLLGRNYDSGTIVNGNGLIQSAEVVARTYPVWSAKLETKF